MLYFPLTVLLKETKRSYATKEAENRFVTVSDKELEKSWRNAGALFVNGGFESESSWRIASLLRETLEFRERPRKACDLVVRSMDG